MRKTDASGQTCLVIFATRNVAPRETTVIMHCVFCLEVVKKL